MTLTIALDYDETFTEDPEIWIPFIKHARSRGHKVICVTLRFEDDDEVKEVMGPLCDDVICTSGEDKEPASLRSGWSVDIWIDDSPEFIRSEGAKTR